MSKIKGILKRYAFLRDYIVLSDIETEIDGEEHDFSYILLGVFGVLTVRVFSEKGELYGNDNDKTFVLLDRMKNRKPVENLFVKASADGDAIRRIITKEKIYNIKTESVIVIEKDSCKPVISGDKIKIFSAGDFKKYLNSGKFDIDLKADTAALTAAVEKYRK